MDDTQARRHPFAELVLIEEAKKGFTGFALPLNMVIDVPYQWTVIPISPVLRKKEKVDKVAEEVLAVSKLLNDYLMFDKETRMIYARSARHLFKGLRNLYSDLVDMYAGPTDNPQKLHMWYFEDLIPFFDVAVKRFTLIFRCASLSQPQTPRQV